MKPGVSVSIDRMADLKRSLKKLTGDRVLVGIPAANADRQPELGETFTLNNAAIGYLMETGDPERNLPARPFLFPGIEDAKPKLIKRLGAAGKAALDGDTGLLGRNLAAVGQKGASSVQSKITNGPFTPLSPSTLAARRSRGRTGDKPLLDTGQLRRAITFVVELKS